MVRYFVYRSWPLLAAAALLALALSLAPSRIAAQDAFFSLLFPQLIWPEADGALPDEGPEAAREALEQDGDGIWDALGQEGEAALEAAQTRERGAWPQDRALTDSAGSPDAEASPRGARWGGRGLGEAVAL